MATKSCNEWGFDLTGFRSSEDFRDLLKRHDLTQRQIVCVPWGGGDGNPYSKFKKVRKGESECMYLKYRYANKDNSLILETGNEPLLGCFNQPTKREPEAGYASAIGITGKPDKIKRLADDIRRTAEYVKDESKCGRSFI